MCLRIKWFRHYVLLLLVSTYVNLLQTTMTTAAEQQGKKLETVADYGEVAKTKYNKLTSHYINGGAGEMFTLKHNLKAFDNFRIRPMFWRRDVSKRNISTSFLGMPVSSPIGASPAAMEKLSNPEGEKAIARACQAIGNVYIMSMHATTSIEEVARAGPLAIKWMQLVPLKNKTYFMSLIRRAEKAGFKALVISVDTPYYSKFQDEICLPAPYHLSNLPFENVSCTEENTIPKGQHMHKIFDASVTWDYLSWIKSLTNLPILVKGVLTAEDALEAIKQNVSGIIVSNMGGRILDKDPATIEVLPEIINAVRLTKPSVQVYIDSGFRTGTDVLMAVAMGATGVFVGRPVHWGLAVNGEDGVKSVFGIMNKELKQVLGLAGCAKLSDAVGKNLVVRKQYFDTTRNPWN